MRTNIIVLIGVFVGLGVGLCIHRQSSETSVRDDSGDNLTSDQRLQHWRSQTHRVMLERCTNDVVGFSKVIQSVIADEDSNIQHWWGSVTCEHVNTVGVIERTNMWYVFNSSGGNVYCVNVDGNEATNFWASLTGK